MKLIKLFLIAAIIFFGNKANCQEQTNLAKVQPVGESVSFVQPDPFLQKSFSENEERYEKARRMRTAGILMTVGGAAMITAGSLVTERAEKPESGNFGERTENYVGGTILTVAGVALTGGGIAMWIVGNNKMRKNRNVSLTVQPSKVGLAYRL